jgi:hypothetical protein
MKTLRLLIERLESRDVPASMSIVDVDGDLVTVKTSKGTDAQLTAVVTLAASGVPGGKAINGINLGSNAVFDGTDLAVTAKPGPLGGDGLVNVFGINATNLDLGTVTIDGGLTGYVTVGKNTPISKVKAINVRSAFGTDVWTIDASVGSIRVAGDLADQELDVSGPGGIGTLSIGGSLIGNPTEQTGFIGVPNGAIGSVKIGRDIIGGTGLDSGEIKAHEMGTVSIGGSIRGAATDPGRGPTRTGVIEASAAIGAVRIGGSIIGGALGTSGFVHAGTTLASIRVGGSLVGGLQNTSGVIQAAEVPGTVKIGGDIVGDGGLSSGQINVAGTVGSVRVGGTVFGGSNITSGVIGVGGGAHSTIRITGDLIGGTVLGAGDVLVSGDMGAISIGGSVIGSVGVSSGIGLSGTAGAISIGKNVVGSSVGFPVIIGAFGNPTAPAKQSVAIKSLIIGGRVENAVVNGGNTSDSGNPDAQIGTVKVGGDWIASNLVVGVDPGADNLFGTADDAPISQTGEPDAFFSKIGSITIAGSVYGTTGGGDHFGFVAQEIGAFSVNGVAHKLTAGHSNDTSTSDSHLSIGATGDVTIHEV